jgi:GT2 family glycosyltransferase
MVVENIQQALARFTIFRDEIKQELITATMYKEVYKDICIVVHNQLDYLEVCIESIRLNTQNYKIYVWDNGSKEDVKDWLSNQSDLIVTTSETNEGFIKPNNALVRQGNSPYIILLNSDTIVREGWDKALIAYCQEEKVAQTGYGGGFIGPHGHAEDFGFGSDVDYILGWCSCIPREIYDRYGLFDEQNLSFAYCEDADFSLRLLESGESIHALHLGLVNHFGNVTIKQVANERECSHEIMGNQAYLKTRWGDFVLNRRKRRKVNNPGNLG